MEWEQQPSSTATTGLRRRTKAESYSNSLGNGLSNNYNNSSYNSKKLKKRVVRNLDLFPKIEQDLVVKSSSTGNKLTLVAYALTIIIILAEIYSHNMTNNQLKEHVTVDKSLGKKMRVDLNITFPALHCTDVHMDIMDVAGDSHTDVEDTIIKKRLHIDGSELSKEEITMDLNKAYQKEKEIMEAIDKTLKPDYCGPCYGAGEEGECCNHCDDVLNKYNKNKWSTYDVKLVAEQCVREGKTKPDRMKHGEGCNVSGFMKFNRVNGNFHIAMGEGVERNGQHIHTFIPDDVVNFNASHIIHELRFGPDYSDGLFKSFGSEPTTLEGVTKIVTKENGVSGMFQYFIKIVPTTYTGEKLVKKIAPNYKDTANEIPQLETNRYFTTERYTPLMLEIDDENWELGELVASRYKEHHDKIAEKSKAEKDGGDAEKPKKKKGADDLLRDDDHIPSIGKMDDVYDDDYYDFYYERQVHQPPDKVAAAKVGGNSGTSHNHHEHHRKQQSILPGIFFIYQIYPFHVEISQEHVPLTHLLIRILSTIGGVFTIMGMVDTVLSSRSMKR